MVAAAVGGWKQFKHKAARDAEVPGRGHSGGEARIRTEGESFAGSCLTTWPLRHMKKADRNRP